MIDDCEAAGRLVFMMSPPKSHCVDLFGLAMSGSPARVFQRIMTPVHQGLSPPRIGDISGRTLLEMTVDVSDDLAHVAVIIVAQGRGLLRPDLNDTRSYVMADRFGWSPLTPVAD